MESSNEDKAKYWKIIPFLSFALSIFFLLFLKDTSAATLAKKPQELQKEPQAYGRGIGLNQGSSLI